MNQFQMPGLSGYGNLKIHFTDYRVYQALSRPGVLSRSIVHHLCEMEQIQRMGYGITAT